MSTEPLNGAHRLNGTPSRYLSERGPGPEPGPEAPPLRRPRDNRRSARTARPDSQPGRTPPAGATSEVTGPITGLLGPMTGGLRLLRDRAGGPEQRLRVDWPSCKAHGLCAEIAPEVIRLDEWGYPLFDSGGLSGAVLATARKAVQVCPTLALRLTDVPPA